VCINTHGCHATEWNKLIYFPILKPGTCVLKINLLQYNDITRKSRGQGLIAKEHICSNMYKFKLTLNLPDTLAF